MREKVVSLVLDTLQPAVGVVILVMIRPFRGRYGRHRVQFDKWLDHNYRFDDRDRWADGTRDGAAGR